MLDFVDLRRKSFACAEIVAYFETIVCIFFIAAERLQNVKLTLSRKTVAIQRHNDLGQNMSPASICLRILLVPQQQNNKHRLQHTSGQYFFSLRAYDFNV
jgi:hypothetical protein